MRAEDVRKIDFSAIRRGDVDVVIGGPLCQDFSIVRGPEKERQGLFVKRGGCTPILLEP